MPVRRTSQGNFSGYGSFGQLVIQNAEVTIADIREEANNAILFRPDADIPTDPIAHIFTKISWRWKFSLGQFNADLVQLYNGRTLKRKLGVVITEHLGYVTSEEYVYFPNQMSAQRYMVAKFSAEEGFERNDDIPCDEPPSDVNIEVVEQVTWANSSWLPLLGAFPVSSSQNNVQLGDKVSFYPEKGLNGYLFGGSYNYEHSRVFASQVANGYNPPLINL